MRYHKARARTTQGVCAPASREASMQRIPKRRTATLVLALSAAMGSVGYMPSKAETRIPMNEDGTERIRPDPELNRTYDPEPPKMATPEVATEMSKAPTHTTGAEKGIELDEEGIELNAPVMMGETQSEGPTQETTLAGGSTEEGKDALNGVAPSAEQSEEAPLEAPEEHKVLQIDLPTELAIETPMAQDDATTAELTIGTPHSGETAQDESATITARKTKTCELTTEREREARAGDQLVNTITRWAGQDGWRVVAKTRYDWPIEAGHTSTGPLDEAVLEITEAYKAVQPAPKVTAYGRNCVIVIRDNAARSG